MVRISFLLLFVGLSLAVPSDASRQQSSPALSTRCTTAIDGKLPAQTPSDFHYSGNVRKYYIAAEEIDWDYAPSGWDNWLGLPLHHSPRAQSAGITKHGTKWRKAVYRGYTDGSFTAKTIQPEWQGLQGPTLRAEVGDMIEILFLNRLSHNFASMHSMGLAYSKGSEGAVYPNGASANSPGDAVPPGGCAVYKWLVPDSSAPSADELANMHGYHSYISMQEDMSAGLIGPQFTYQRGMMDHTMSQYHEFPVLFQSVDESSSFMAGINAQQLKNSSAQLSHVDFSELMQYGNESSWRPQLTNLVSSKGFDDAPKFQTVNGYTFANIPTFKMCRDDKVIWYVYAQGKELHVFHLHGNGFTNQGINRAAITVDPGTMLSLYMNAANVGLWQLICHINDHLSSGMVANYQVMDEGCH